MSALKLNDVPARVVAWHNRHPLARRIDLSHVNSIGGVGLPFASDRPAATAAAPTPTPPPALPTDPMLQPPEADAALPDARPAAAPSGQPSEDTPAQSSFAASMAAAPDEQDSCAQAPVATPDAELDERSEAAEGPATEPRASAAPDLAADDAPGPDHPVEEPVEDTDAEPELVMAFEEEAADASAANDDRPLAADELVDKEAAPGGPADADLAALADAADSTDPASEKSPGAQIDEAEHAPPSTTGADEPALPSDPDLDTAGTLSAEPAHPHAESGPPTAGGSEPVAAAVAGSLASRLEAARAAAQATSDSTSSGKTTQRKPWWERLLHRLGLGAKLPAPTQSGRAVGADDSPRALGHPGALRPLFDRRLFGRLSPKAVADWARQHGARENLAPTGWPQRRVKPDVAMLQQVRGSKQAHVVHLHLITAAVDVDGQRTRVLLDAEGHLLGARLMSPARIGAALGTGVLVIGLGTWTGLALLTSHSIDEPLIASAQAAADRASAAQASPPASLARAVTPPASMAGAAASAAESPVTSPVAAPQRAVTAASAADLAPHESPTASAAEPSAALAQAAASGPRLGAAAPHEPQPIVTAAASTPPAKPIVPGGLTITTEPPPAFPERRASGPLAQIRPTMSAEQREEARQRSEAARSAARGEPSAQAVTSSTRDPAGAPTAVLADRYFAVVSEGSPQRESAEARLAQMLSVRAQLPAPLPSHTELLQLGNRWHAAQWPFMEATEAERARTLMSARGLKAEVVAF